MIFIIALVLITINIAVITISLVSLIKFKTLAFRDSKTGLFNTTYFNTTKNREEDVYIFIDIDNFKEYNRMGYTYGDRILERFSSYLIQCKRNFERACRIGGDEFAIICNNFDTANDYVRRLNELSTDIKFSYKVTSDRRDACQELADKVNKNEI